MNLTPNYDDWIKALADGRRVYAVIGDPIEHSFSPQMQNAAFAAAGLGRPYTKLRVSGEELPDFIAFARTHLRGVNVTIPHKQRVITLLDAIDPAAAAAESVNTLVISSGRVTGYSTDGIGLEFALTRHFDRPISGGKFLFLGAGGAAWATSVTLAQRGAAAIDIANRTVDKAERLAEAINRRTPCRARALALADTEKLISAIQKADFLIQTTSLGLHESDAPVLPETVLASARPQLAVFDLIYRDTALLQAARQLGLAGADGREMLIGQGAASFRLWTGKAPDLDAMRRGFAAPSEEA